jgi:hypothetical protein
MATRYIVCNTRDVRQGYVAGTGANQTTSGTDVLLLSGCSVTLVPAVASSVTVVANLDIAPNTAGDIFVFNIELDSVVQKFGVIQLGATGRSVISANWTMALSAASHVIRLSVQRVTGTGTALCRQTNGGFSWILMPVL